MTETGTNIFNGRLIWNRRARDIMKTRNATINNSKERRWWWIRIFLRYYRPFIFFLLSTGTCSNIAQYKHPITMASINSIIYIFLVLKPQCEFMQLGPNQLNGWQWIERTRCEFKVIHRITYVAWIPLTITLLSFVIQIWLLLQSFMDYNRSKCPAHSL